MKDLSITEVRGARANISDLQVYGNGDTFQLLCKASSQEQGWMKSTKVANVPGGCIVQVTTQQRNPDGSYYAAIKLAEEEKDNVTRNLLEMIVKDEDTHIDAIEAYKDQINQMGAGIFFSTQTA